MFSLCSVPGLQFDIFDLERRVTLLEENGDNSSIAELDLRVTDLEMENENQEELIITNTQSIEGENCSSFIHYQGKNQNAKTKT